MTCFLGLVDPPSGRFTYASAGQGPAFFYCGRDGEISVRMPTYPPLGVSLLDPVVGTEQFWSFERGDSLVLVSDGVYEATQPSGERFGIDRIRESLLDTRDASADHTVAQLRRDVEGFAGPEPQQDDMTIVVIRKV